MTFCNPIMRYGIVLTASVAILSASTQALACQYGSATSDTALENTFPIPTFLSAKDFVARQASDFYIARDSWTGHGIEAFDDKNFEYTKHWMASYLIANGADFEHRASGTDSTGHPFELLLDRAFHSASDYYNMAKAEPTRGDRITSGCSNHGGLCYGPPWHGRFVSLLGGVNPDLLGEYNWSEHPPVAAMLFWPLALFPEKTETVTTFCGLYDVQEQITAPVSNGPPISLYLQDTVNIYGTPPERATTLVHEGMHAHYRDVGALDHVDCATGATDADGACDHFYPHPKSAFKGGDLNHANASTLKIPAFELEYEYLCDLLDEGKDWVPVALISDAEATARRTTGHFVDSHGAPSVPPYSCGVPAPLMEVPDSACRVSACTTDSQCGQNGICSGGCCAVIK